MAEDISTDKSEDDGGEESRPSSKVARLLEKYDLGEGVGADLEERWTAEGDQRESLRSLAERFNKQLLRAAMTDDGISTLDGEVSNIYRLLTSDDVSSGRYLEARNRLKREGVDVDELERDFVTYQAIRSYLKDYRGAEYEHRSDETGRDTVAETIQRLKSRVESVTRTSLDQLHNGDAVSLGNFRVFVEVKVLCEDCGSQYGVVELLDRGGCDCE